MKDKLYFMFYRKLGNQKLAILLSEYAHRILMLGFYIAKFFAKRTVATSYEDAYHLIESVHTMEYSKSPIAGNEINPAIDLSIIIPVYNVEQFLEECLQSVFNQDTIYRYEVIVINDGSTDQSKDILLRYAEKDNYKIINQENGGIARARNTGINQAKGKNYFFLDSDDVITPNCVQIMLDTLYHCEAEMVQCRYYSFQDGTSKKYVSKEPAGIYYNAEIPIEEYPGFPWAKIYKAELFEEVRFPEGLWFEDTIVQYMLFGKCKKFVCTEEVCYGYRKNPNSISFVIKRNLKCFDTYWTTKHIIEQALKEDKINKDYIYKLTLRQYSLIMYNRLHWVDEPLLEAVFAVVCEEVCEIKPEGLELKGIYKEIEKAFETKNINLWKMCSVVL